MQTKFQPLLSQVVDIRGFSVSEIRSWPFYINVPKYMQGTIFKNLSVPDKVTLDILPQTELTPYEQDEHNAIATIGALHRLIVGFTSPKLKKLIDRPIIIPNRQLVSQGIKFYPCLRFSDGYHFDICTISDNYPSNSIYIARVL